MEFLDSLTHYAVKLCLRICSGDFLWTLLSSSSRFASAYKTYWRNLYCIMCPMLLYRWLWLGTFILDILSLNSGSWQLLRGLRQPGIRQRSAASAKSDSRNWVADHRASSRAHVRSLTAILLRDRCPSYLRSVAACNLTIQFAVLLN